jgi:SAM-dependent methyltransferase
VTLSPDDYPVLPNVPALSPDIAAHRGWLLSFVEPPPGGIVLDLGCGRGEDLRTLAARHPDADSRFVGIDASEENLTAGRADAAADPRLRFQRHDLGEPIPLAEASVDVVYSHNLLECLADPAALVHEAARVLKPGGQLVLGHWDWDSQVWDGLDRERVRRLVHAFADWQQEWMGHADGWMGRRLWGVVQSSGSFDGAAHARVLTNTEYLPPWFGHANARAMRSLARRGLVDAGDVEAFESEQSELHRQGRYIYGISGYVYVGRLKA